MSRQFWKYEGAGNDFVILRGAEPTPEQVRAMCDRHRGVGADGLMVLAADADHDFRMIYFNADGSRASMCGNGARCIALFARDIGLGSSLNFVGDDGEHHATVFGDGTVEVSMRDVPRFSTLSTGFVLNTGVPHYVEFVPAVEEVDVVARGRALRHDPRFQPAGANVNFASLKEGVLHVRTYERGVEDETLACGTGAVASAVASHIKFAAKPPIHVQVPGGALQVDFNAADGFTDITLTGPARQVFKGEWND